jgi:hypothetical protein
MRRSARTRGFAMVMAIVLVGMVATTLVALSAGFAHQATRTRLLAEDAQLRQLLLAGTQIAAARLHDSRPADGVVTLPDSLQLSGAALTIRMVSGAPGQDQVVEILAILPRHRLSQQLHLQARDGQLQITSAQLVD